MTEISREFGVAGTLARTQQRDGDVAILIGREKPIAGKPNDECLRFHGSEGGFKRAVSMSEIELIERADLKVRDAIREVYDPEIPVNVYELGLIYKFDFTKMDDGQYDVYVQMSLTSPACPVAQEMPGMVQSALFPIDKVGAVDVEIVWDPTWDPAFMAETAKLQLNMFT